MLGKEFFLEKRLVYVSLYTLFTLFFSIGGGGGGGEGGGERICCMLPGMLILRLMIFSKEKGKKRRK